MLCILRHEIAVPFQPLHESLQQTSFQTRDTTQDFSQPRKWLIKSASIIPGTSRFNRYNSMFQPISAWRANAFCAPVTTLRHKGLHHVCYHVCHRRCGQSAPLEPKPKAQRGNVIRNLEEWISVRMTYWFMHARHMMLDIINNNCRCQSDELILAEAHDELTSWWTIDKMMDGSKIKSTLLTSHGVCINLTRSFGLRQALLTILWLFACERWTVLTWRGMSTRYKAYRPSSKFSSAYFLRNVQNNVVVNSSTAVTHAIILMACLQDYRSSQLGPSTHDRPPLDENACRSHLTAFVVAM